MAVRHPKNLDQDVSLCLPAPDRMNWPTVSRPRPEASGNPAGVPADEVPQRTEDRTLCTTRAAFHG